MCHFHQMTLQEVKFGEKNYDVSGNDDGFKVIYIHVNPLFSFCSNNLAKKIALAGLPLWHKIRTSSRNGSESFIEFILEINRKKLK